MFTYILLQAANPGMMNLVFIVGMIVVFYFFMIRPQQKRQKDQKSFEESLSTGDQIVTTGGIHGKIIAIEGSTVTLEIDKGVRMKCERFAVSQALTKALQAANAKKD